MGYAFLHLREEESLEESIGFHYCVRRQRKNNCACKAELQVKISGPNSKTAWELEKRLESSRHIWIEGKATMGRWWLSFSPAVIRRPQGQYVTYQIRKSWWRWSLGSWRRWSLGRGKQEIIGRKSGSNALSWSMLVLSITPSVRINPTPSFLRIDWLPNML